MRCTARLLCPAVCCLRSETAALRCCSYEPAQAPVSDAQPTEASVEQRAAHLAGGSAHAFAPDVPLAEDALAALEQVPLPSVPKGIQIASKSSAPMGHSPNRQIGCWPMSLSAHVCHTV